MAWCVLMPGGASTEYGAMVGAAGLETHFRRVRAPPNVTVVCAPGAPGVPAAIVRAGFHNRPAGYAHRRLPNAAIR